MKHIARKRFGQHFLSDQATIDALVRAINPSAGDRMVEIGPGLAALTQSPASTPRWAGPYLKKSAPADPWGRPYVFRSPGEHGEFDLYSLGKDGQPGGAGDDRDVTNW